MRHTPISLTMVIILIFGSSLMSGTSEGVSASAVLPQCSSPMKGQVIKRDKGKVVIHTYLPGRASSGRIATHIIETERRLVIINTQFLEDAAREVKCYAESLGKPIDRIMITSSENPDWSGPNWMGNEVFKGSPIFTTPAIRGWMRELPKDTPLLLSTRISGSSNTIVVPDRGMTKASW